MIRLILSFAFVFGLNLLFAQQKTYTVNTIDDVDDGVCNEKHCSLREAIEASNNDKVPSKIGFNILGTFPHIIKPRIENLTFITEDNTVIDATSQPGYYDGIIQISGELLNPVNSYHVGLAIRGGQNCEIYGLYIHSVKHFGLVIFDEANNISVGAKNKRNIFSKNGENGIYVFNSWQINIKNNYIGLLPDGNQASPNETGIYAEYCSDLKIGGNRNEEGNIMASNDEQLWLYKCSSSRIEGNKFGSNYLGNKRVISSNRFVTGVYLDQCQGITVGGESSVHGNFFAGNLGHDLIIDQCQALNPIKVHGNYFGISYDLKTKYADTITSIPGILHTKTDVAIIIVGSENIEIGSRKNNSNINFFGLQGVSVETFSEKVRILENSFVCMDQDDLIKIDGTSNLEKQPPEISYVSPWEVKGNADPGDSIDVFSVKYCDEDRFGNSYTIDTIIFSLVADSTGNWQKNFLSWIVINNPNTKLLSPIDSQITDSPSLIALSRDKEGNSSPFSDVNANIENTDYVEVTTTNDLIGGSLRSALYIAGQSSHINKISFNLPKTGPYSFNYNLFQLEGTYGDSVIVDATTQPNFRTGDIIIDGEGKEDSYFEISDNNYELYGLTFRNMTNGLIVSGDNNIIGGEGIRANNFINCKNAGILVTGINNVIQNNVIGAEINTLSMKPNGTGIIVDKVKTGITKIGGSEGWQSNQIIGNNSDGIKIMNSGDPSKSNSIIIEGNEIGVGFNDQTIKIRNGGNGINIENSVNVLIGGTNPNIIAGNLGHGLLINNSSANVYNNRIGYSVGLGNERNGVHILGSSIVNVGNPKNTVGGDYANRIAYNGGYGIWRDNLQPQISHNEIYCNQRGGFFVNGTNAQENITINESSLHALKGSSNIPSGLLEIYKTSGDCKNLPCQGGQLLSIVQTDSRGNWELKNFGTPLLPNESVSVCKAGSPTNFFGCTPVICPQFTNLKDILRKDTSICSSQLTINTPLSNLEKIAWSASDNSIGISQSLINQWSIKNLKLGANTIFRNLSTPECGTYYRDTIKIFQYPPPSANNDSFNIQIKGRQPTTIDLLANDVLDTTNLEITLNNLPSWRSGNLIHKGKGKLEFQPRFIENESGTFSYTICSGVCKKCASAQAYINVEAYDRKKAVFVPSGLTINDDGKNDQLIISGLDQFPKNRLRIFSRWGDLVYDQENYTNGSPWTGKGKNEQFLPQGTYYYVLQLDGHSEIIKGTIHILTN